MNRKEQEIQSLLNSLSKKLGKSPDTLKQNVQSGNIDSLMDNLDKKQAEKIRSILNDEEKTKQLLNNPEVKALMKKLTGE